MFFLIDSSQEGLREEKVPKGRNTVGAGGTKGKGRGVLMRLPGTASLGLRGQSVLFPRALGNNGGHPAEPLECSPVLFGRPAPTPA